jgi:hypothetical protein
MLAHQAADLLGVDDKPQCRSSAPTRRQP